MTALTSSAWRHCSMCKVPIGFEAEYFTCSVSTCNRKRTGLYFCTVACFEAHLPTARHRDAWAEPQRSPSVADAKAQAQLEAADDDDGTQPGPAPQRRVVTAASAPRASEESEQGGTETDVLIVVSKLKKYVRDRSGMNTSDSVTQVLSDHVRALCREAIRQAGQDGRRTVLDRDFTKVLAQLDTAAQQRGEGNFRSQR
ncbi:MAG: hypothetical protein RL685_359 [Pseudomonadota bacterium]